MILYWPDPSVVADRTFSISAGLAASTVTPGITAPEASLTTPAIELWAAARAGIEAIHVNAMRIRTASGRMVVSFVFTRGLGPYARKNNGGMMLNYRPVGRTIAPGVRAGNRLVGIS